MEVNLWSGVRYKYLWITLIYSQEKTPVNFPGKAMERLSTEYFFLTAAKAERTKTCDYVNKKPGFRRFGTVVLISDSFLPK